MLVEAICLKIPYKQRIENKDMSSIVRNIHTFVVVLLVCCLSGYSSFAQLYTGSKHCVQANPSSVPSTPPTGTGTGGTPSAACPTPSYFFDQDTRSVSRRWDFAGSGIFTPGERGAYFSYATPGTYTIQVEKTYADGTTKLESKELTVGSPPAEPLFNRKRDSDTTVCKGSSLKLDPYIHRLSIPPTNVRYKWYPNGETTPTLEVEEPGCYSVEVIDITSGCSQTARINVKFCLQPPPTAGGSERWYFGQGATLEFSSSFNGTTPERDSLAADGSLFAEPENTGTNSFSPNNTASTIPNKIRTNGASAMVFDAQGELAFYTDGRALFDLNDSTLTSSTPGDSLLGTALPTKQGVAIMPKFGCYACNFHEYYAFYVDKTTGFLSYSIIDTRVQQVAGKITEKGIPLVYPANESLRVIPKPDDTGYLLVAQELNSSKFYTFQIDSSGVQQVVSTIPPDTTAPIRYLPLLASNQEGDVLVTVKEAGADTFLEIMELDVTTGQISRTRKVKLTIPAGSQLNGLSLSPNGERIYFTVYNPTASPFLSALYQVSTMDDGNPVREITTSMTQQFGALQTGPVSGDGAKYLYLAVDGSLSLPYIQAPNDYGMNAADVGFVASTDANAAPLARPSGIGFPQVVHAPREQEGDGIQATYTGNCFQSPTILSVEEVCSPQRNEIEWKFEDGSTLKEKQVSYVFPKIGWNKINLRIKTYNQTRLAPVAGAVGGPLGGAITNALETLCTDTTIVDSIFIKPIPVYNLPDSFYVCLRNSPVIPTRINPDPTGGSSFDYRWLTTLDATFSTAPFYDFVIPQTFRLEITNNFDCVVAKQSKAVSGCEPILYVPDIFTPNDDGINDTFVPLPIFTSTYQLLIFNRWGEIVFESNDPDTRWDGSVRGKTIAPAVYTYQVRYTSLDFPERGTIVKSGTVTVLK